MKYLWNKRMPEGGNGEARDRGPRLGCARSRELTLIITSSTMIRGGKLWRSCAPSRANIALLVTDARLPRMVALLFSVYRRRRRRRS